MGKGWLTEGMLVLLGKAMSGEVVSPWDFSSSAVGACKRLGYLRPVKVLLGGKTSTRYVITESGRQAYRDG